MVIIREKDSVMLFGISHKLLRWEKNDGHQPDSPEEIEIPEPVLSENLTKGQIEVIKKEKKTITCIEFSKNGEYIAVCTENKQLVLFNGKFELVKNILLQRVSSKVCFTPSNDVLVADKAGDVYLYRMNDEKNQTTLLLGHLSVILDMIISNCGKYIITCDRDEKIRVSHYPNAYNIVSYCLGHTEFVTCMKILKNKHILLSASGDGTIRIWDYLKGKQLNVIDTKEVIDEKILMQFAFEMDEEKVHVTKLPITNMEIYETGEQVVMLISLHGMDKLVFYKFDTNSLECVHVTTMDNLCTFTFHVSVFSNRFYIFSENTNLMVFQFVKDSEISFLVDNFLSDSLSRYKELLNFNSEITFLYKRQFDNVQEYMEKKKQRLESK